MNYFVITCETFSSKNKSFISRHSKSWVSSRGWLGSLNRTTEVLPYPYFSVWVELEQIIIENPCNHLHSFRHGS